MTDLRPSAVQSETIHPHSTVLNGKAPYTVESTWNQTLLVWNVDSHNAVEWNGDK